MKLKITSILFMLLVTLVASAQKKSDVIMTIDGNPVYANEFVRVYQKNLELVQDESQKSVDGYLDLFVDYKLKVAEAYEQGLNNNDDYRKEFSKYEEQLSRNYLYEDKVTTDLAKLAYERGKYDLKVAHILVRSSYDDVPQDTLKAYNKIKEALDKARSGEDFGTLAGTYSEEPGAAERGGDIGYFSTFTMVHQFEDMAYETPVGEISDIVRTQFGYHILKVEDKRERSPDITVSHIMISDKDNAARTFDPEERINEVNTLLKQGSSFEDLAKQYSEDKNSGKKGGKLNRFGKGQLRSAAFEEVAYGLKNVGDVSEPFKTEFGWHIVRLDEKHTHQTFEEQKEMLEKKVGEGPRSKIVVMAVNEKIKEKYGFKGEDNFKPFFTEFVTDSIFNKTWDFDENFSQKDKMLFEIGDDYTATYGDFASFIKQLQLDRGLPKNKSRIIADGYDMFETQELKKYFRTKLEETNEDYASVISEYRDGLLIFDVMRLNVWDKAKKDTIGSKAYYEAHKQNYNWKKRISADVISSSQEDMIKVASTMLSNGKTIQEIKEALNQNDKISIIASSGKYEEDDQSLPENFVIEKGVSKPYEQHGNFVIVNVKDIIPSRVKLYDEVKGGVISDYQKQVEKEWMESLRDKHKVEVNKKTLNKVKKQFD
ncbi:possible peptidyl-prolyl cis-trans isomerase [unidentified eubacterium SCB49]|nr:possible peptidyl-prolyl cis-trans isomerase [unidentified eubacterium SCB49]